MEGISQKDPAYQSFYQKISENDYELYKPPNKLTQDFVYLKNYKAILVKIYDQDTDTCYNDEYLGSLYANSDKISHLLNINQSNNFQNSTNYNSTSNLKSDLINNKDTENKKNDD